MGHLTIVTTSTVQEVLDTGFISTRGNLGSLAVKTISDLFSDVLATRKGDYVFPWIIRGEGTPNLGFKYIFKVGGSPIYVKGDEYPIKLPIDELIIEYDQPLSEADALDLFGAELLWNAIGKKSLGRGRSLTHQTFLEDDLLIKLLDSRNPEGAHQKKITRKSYPNSAKISIDLTQDHRANGFLESLENVDEYDRISELELSKIPWANRGYFSYEKTFEAWLMENIGNNKCDALWEILGYPEHKIIWCGNYLPFGVAGSNIDAVILTETKNGLKAIVIELKNNELGLNGYKVICAQVMGYSKFIHRAFSSYKSMPKFEVIPVIISAVSDDHNANQTCIMGGIPIRWLGYDIIKGIIEFNDHFINNKND